MIDLQLAVGAPFAGDDLMAFMARRAVAGIEAWDGSSLHRSLDLPNGHGVAVITPAETSVRVQLRLADPDDLDAAVRRIRRLLDLDVDPVVVDGVLAADPVLRPLVLHGPGLRVPGSVDPFETAVRAIVGQQISVAGARTIVGRIVSVTGAPLTVEGGPLTHVFATPDALAAVDPVTLPMPRRRGRTIVELARRVAAGELPLDADADRDDVVAGLLDVPGVGPWTAGYVLMRGFGDPDVFLATDLGARAGLAVVGVSADDARRWRPWRSYALHHLWAVA